MRKLLLLLSLVAVVLAALLTFELRRRDAEAWSTDSPAALAAFKRGLQAYMHLYGEDASREFEAALAADPGFLAPHFFLLGRGRGRGHLPPRGKAFLFVPSSSSYSARRSSDSTRP